MEEAKVKMPRVKFTRPLISQPMSIITSPLSEADLLDMEDSDGQQEAEEQRPNM